MRFVNFAIPIVFALGLLVASLGYALLGQLLMFLGASESVAVIVAGWTALLGTIVASFIYVKRKVNFDAPSTKKTTIGHLVLALANIAALTTTVGPLLYAHFSGRPDNALYMYFSLPVIFVNLALWPLGWKLATSSNKQDA